MMDSFLDGSPWGVKMLVYFGTILVIFLFMCAIPIKYLQWMARTPGLTANCWTTYRIFITLAGIPLWLHYKTYEAFFVLVVGYLLDFFDGLVAKAGALLKDPRNPGMTKIGKVYDPAADKVCVHPHYLSNAFLMGLFSPVPCLVMASVELVGTIVRWPFTELKFRPFPAIKARLRKSDSTGVGKTKMALMCINLMLTVPYTKGWWISSSQWMNWVIWGFVVLAAASVASRMSLHKTVDEAVDSFTAPFNHVNKFARILNWILNKKKGWRVAS